jgi:hypothetical protein
VTGCTPDARDAATLNLILNDVAFALSNLVPVFTSDGQSAMPKAVDPRELLDGQFSRGAHVFTTSDGREVRGLTVQRRELNKAIEILRTAGVRFPRPG